LWDKEYQAAMERKAAWVTEATEAADQAGDYLLAATVGMEAEQAERDLNLFGMSGEWKLETGALDMVKELLNTAGIVNAAGALEAINATAARQDATVRATVDGQAQWSSAQVADAVARQVRDNNDAILRE
jgi:hypothetical protein